ncbi:MAG: hypothetical protein M0Z67_02655 [Nitrospiraceae bacterium]|nr:hypothetical protein [Nitrospiraceae bacterium]
MPRDENIYVRTYFRVESGYVWGQGMPEEKCWAFYFEIVRILDAIGFKNWKKSGSGSCFEGFRGSCESLYCHPQDLVGWVKKDKVEEIADVLRKGATFKLYRVDTYEDAYNYTVEELKAALPERKEELEGQLLERFRTPRRNLFKFPDLDIRTGLAYFSHRGELRQVESLFIQSTFEELVSCGKIARAEKDGRPVYRTAIPLPGVAGKKKLLLDPTGSEPLFGEKEEEVKECRV